MVPQIFCLHNRWNGPEVQKLMDGQKPFYFTILRDPVEVFVSMWDYFEVSRKMFDNISLEKFADTLANTQYNMTLLDIYLRDTFLYDFGVSIGNVQLLFT